MPIHDSLPWHQGSLSDSEIAAVMRVLRSRHWAAGPEVEAFEAEFANWIGRRHAIAVSSGTAAWQLVLSGLGIGAGDEVLLPALTFIACANAVVHCGARPVLADVTRDTLTLRASEESGSRSPKVVLGVDLFGNLANWDALDSNHKSSLLVEDACQALGSRVGDRKAGTFGRASIFSFFSNKVISTGEGGMIVTDDEDLAQTLRKLRSQGRLLNDTAGVHDRIGFNFRMAEIPAALGRSQLQRLPELLARRSRLAGWYAERIKLFGESVQPVLQASGERGWFNYPVLLHTRFDPDRVARQLGARGIPAKRTYLPIHQQPPYRNVATIGPLVVSNDLGPRILSLPFFSEMSEPEVERVIDEIQCVIREQS